MAPAGFKPSPCHPTSGDAPQTPAQLPTPSVYLPLRWAGRSTAFLTRSSPGWEPPGDEAARVSQQIAEHRALQAGGTPSEPPLILGRSPGTPPAPPSDPSPLPPSVTRRLPLPPRRPLRRPRLLPAPQPGLGRRLPRPGAASPRHLPGPRPLSASGRVHGPGRPPG